MAPSRYLSTVPIAQSDETSSRRPTRSHITRPQASLQNRFRRSHIANQNNTELEVDFDNESFIQSIEELLPEQEQAVENSANPLPTLSSQILPTTLDTPIKVERVSDSIDDIYDVSPQGYVCKATNAGRRQTSRSTAQLTTPGSSPEPKRELRNAVAVPAMVKTELIHEGDGRGSLFEISCTPPASSPEGHKLSKSSTSIVPLRRLKRPLSRINQVYINQQGTRENSGQTEESLSPAILPPKPTFVKHNGSQSTAISGHTLSTKVIRPQKANKRPATCESQLEKPPIQYPPILPPPKVRPPCAKTTTPNAVSMRSTPLFPSTPKGGPQQKEDITRGKACCAVIFSKCTTKVVRDESVLEPLGQRPGFSRLKSVSACPSSVSSFSSDDDIPSSDKMYQEFGTAIRESARKFASNHMSAISPSLDYNNLLARLGLHSEALKDMEEVSVYEDFEGDTLPKKNPSRVIFGKAGKNATDYGRTELSLTPRRFCSMEQDSQKGDKSLQRIPSRPLQSFSATNDLSKKPEEFVQGDDYELENEPFNDLIGDENRVEDEVEDEGSCSEYEERISPRVSAQGPLNIKNGSQSVKRVRETNEWAPFLDDEEMVAEDDIVEINRDVFAISENRRKKRHKCSSKEPERDSNIGGPFPKEEASEGNDVFSTAVEDSMPVDTGCMNNSDNAGLDKTPCDYYMNTYWYHGRASDGRRARDGFTSYVDFKEYCRKNRQPTDDRCVLTYKKDLKHYLLCEYHATLRQDLFRAAWNFEHNPGFSFKSCSKDVETRRLQNEAIGNAPSPSSSSRGPAAAKGIGAHMSEVEWNALITHADVVEQENKKLKTILKACLKKSKRRS